MKKIIFTGCSFTHATDSWAHVSTPWIYTDESKDEIEELSKILILARENSIGSNLLEIIEDIELRAKIELAKLEIKT